MSWQSKKSCTRKELESFVGHLAHAVVVIRPGRIFLRSLYALLAGVAKPHFYIRLSIAVHADLQWWYHFLQCWNGSSFFPLPVPTAHVYSDASGSFGCGAFDPSHGWFQLQWPPQWASVEIVVKEMVPIVVAVAVWGPLWEGRHICFHSNNIAVVAVLNKGSTKDHLLLHFLPITPSILRHLFSIWSSPPVSYSACMLWAACSLGFSAFLQSGEFTWSSPSAYVPTMLSPMDVAVDNRTNPSFLAVTLRSSKTDVFGSGVTVYIGATGGPLCPVAAVLSYLAICPPVPGPLFVHQGGRPLVEAV